MLGVAAGCGIQAGAALTREFALSLRWDCPGSFPPSYVPTLPSPPPPPPPRRDMGPALALSILDPRLTWSEAEGAEAAQRGVTVMRGDGSPLDPYDLKRLQVG